MDVGRLIGAVLGGAVDPPAGHASRRRSRTRARDPLAQLGLGTARGRTEVGRALATLAGIAAEALARGGQDPAPAPGPARIPSAGAPAAGRRIPDIGGGIRHDPAPVRQDPPAEAEQAEALLLLRAMIAAAKADGVVDAAERAHVAARLDAAGLSPEERDFVLADLDRPLAPEALAAAVRDPMLAAQVYAAAVAAMGAIAPAERAWLDRLAAALRLDRGAAAAIEQRLGGA
jgi:uncharacterized membrane protein YebE (DUF533 family)